MGYYRNVWSLFPEIVIILIVTIALFIYSVVQPVPIDPYEVDALHFITTAAAGCAITCVAGTILAFIIVKRHNDRIRAGTIKTGVIVDYEISYVEGVSNNVSVNDKEKAYDFWYAVNNLKLSVRYKIGYYIDNAYQELISDPVVYPVNTSPEDLPNHLGDICYVCVYPDLVVKELHVEGMGDLVFEGVVD